MGFCEAIIDIGPERMQRHPPFAIPFGSGNFSASETTGDINAYTLSAQTLSGRNAALHGTAKCHTLLELNRNIFAHKLRIQFRLLNFLHGNIDLTPVLLFEHRL